MRPYTHFLQLLRIMPIETHIKVFYDAKNSECVLYDGQIKDIYTEHETIKQYLTNENNFIHTLRINNNILELIIL